MTNYDNDDTCGGKTAVICRETSIAKAIMGTELLYLDHPALLRAKAKVVEIGFDEVGSFGIFDRTLLCPQGGGQASDTGVLFDGAGNRFPIHKALWGGEEIRHYGPFKTAILNRGERIVLHVDAENRLENAKGHTAGHLIHAVVEKANPHLKANKGHHFAKDAYIRFSGLPEMDVAEMRSEINAGLAQHIERKLPVTFEIVSAAELEKGEASFPFDFPKDKPVRLVRIGDCPPVPCGGTHLSHLGELDSVTVARIKRKKGNTIVSYRFD